MPFFKDQTNIYRVSALVFFPWLEHGFGTRAANPWSSDPALVAVKQIHSDTCVHADGRTGRIGEADALFTATPGALLTVRTADCIPILIVDQRLHTIAAVHAGWRGTVSRIAIRAMEAMRVRFGSRPEDLHAAIGPGIGGCCYEVGPEVAAGFRGIFPEREDLTRRTHVDLAEANRRFLREAGVAENRIYLAELCTHCHADEFHSWRRDGPHAGRMLSAIRVLPHP